ncbi:hypothetical protein ACFL06_00260 [Patescibacteria group bacterium]
MDFVATNILPVVKKQKFALLALLFFIGFGILVPLSQAHAFLTALAFLIGGTFAWIAMAMVLTLTNILLGFAGIMLGWAIDPWFIRYGYTQGGIVDIGWPVVRDLANMGIVIALIFIGLATALRIREYQAQKTLPLLLMVALLINFTPVILGVIIDASNIVMNFFLEELTGMDAFQRQFTALGSMISSELGGMKMLNPLQHITLTFKITIMAIFNVFAAIIFLLFAVLFIMRRVVLWMLVILSPLAFVAYVLPSTRSFFNTWWSQFWNWTIIGVFGGFFLWLGEEMIILAAAGGFVSDVPGTGGNFIQSNISEMMSDIAPYFVALIFILIGFFATLSTSAMGAGGVIKAFQGGAQKAARATRQTAAGLTRNVPGVSRTEERIRRRMETMPVVSGLVGGPGTYGRQRTAELKEAERKLEGMAPRDLQRVFEQRPLTHDQKIMQGAAFLGMQKQGQLQRPDHRAYIPRAHELGLNINDVLERRPDWAEGLVTPDENSPTGYHNHTIAEHIQRAEPNQLIKNIQNEALQNSEVALGIQLDDAKYRQLLRRGKTTQKRTYRDTSRALTVPPAVWAALTPEQRLRSTDRVIDAWTDTQLTSL